MGKFGNKYRIDSTRLQNWNYGWNGRYFITINTKNRAHFFGKVEDGQVYLSAIGKIADELLLEIPARYKYAKLDVHIVMPNHVHVIIVIDKKKKNNVIRIDAIDRISRVAINRASTNSNTSPQTPHLHKPGGVTGIKNPMLHDNISRIFNWYKGRVTYEAHKTDNEFGWQERFHDHIIRNESEYQKIRKYILNNPKNWSRDRRDF
jgi:REP element-mobilizing transposase RayT